MPQESKEFLNYQHFKVNFKKTRRHLRPKSHRCGVQVGDAGVSDWPWQDNRDQRGEADKRRSLLPKPLSSTVEASQLPLVAAVTADISLSGGGNHLRRSTATVLAKQSRSVGHISLTICRDHPDAL